MKEKLRIEYSRLSRPDDLPTTIETHKIITDVAFSILYNHGKAKGLKDIWDEDGNLLYQMTILKSLSLSHYSTPINYENTIDGTTIKNVYDPFSIYSIVRPQYEAFCNFNNIYIQSKSLEELQLKYYLWVLSGLNYRQRFRTEFEDNKQKKQTEASIIEEFMVSVNSNSCFLQLEQQSKINILDMIGHRKWEVKIIGTKAYKIAWHEMITNAGTNEMFEGMYSLLSLNTHPSNASVFQFSSMYKENMHESFTKMAILLSSIYTAWLIRDYVTYFQSCKELFNKMPMMSQMLVNSYNSAFRSDEFLLNDILNILN